MDSQEVSQFTFLQYELPEDRIAQRPRGLTDRRDSSRMLHARFPSGRIVDRSFSELPQLLQPGDLIVLNNTKVLPTRFFARLERTNAAVEVLLLEESRPDTWWAIGKPLRKLAIGEQLVLSPHLRAMVLERAERRVLLHVTAENSVLPVYTLLESEGTMPIPPYIREGKGDALDRELYQTVFAEIGGSVAAPTAALHMTPEVLAAAERRGINHAFLTLHVGPASFMPITVDRLEDHPMPSERFTIPIETVQAVTQTRAAGRRVVAVGTTTVRALETAVQSPIWKSAAGDVVGETSLCISPGFRFTAVDALVTNFHQPRSTHLLLVAALVGSENMHRIYTHALVNDYRFLSYGDSMFAERDED